MNVSGKILVSCKVRTTKEKKEWKSFFATFKEQDGKHPVFVSVRFSKEVPSDKLQDGYAYLLNNVEGFLSADEYNDKSNLVIVITKANVEQVFEPKKAVAKDTKNMPF